MFDLINFEAPATDFGLEDSGAVFPVGERTLASLSPVGEDADPVTGDVLSASNTHKCIVREDTGGIVGVVGTKYRLLSNMNYFSTIEEALTRAIPKKMQKNCQVRTSVTRGGSWARRDYVFPEYAERLKNSVHETSVGLRIIAWNSYDGGSSAGLLTGLIDFYCTNGMLIGKDIEKMARRHSPRLEAGMFVNPLQKSIDGVNTKVQELQAMINRPLKFDDAVELLEKKFSGRRAGEMLARYEIEQEERGANVYALLSAMTHYASHNSDNFAMRTEDDAASQTLHGRELEVQRITSSPEFRSLMEAA